MKPLQKVSLEYWKCPSHLKFEELGKEKLNEFFQSSLCLEVMFQPEIRTLEHHFSEK